MIYFSWRASGLWAGLTSLMLASRLGPASVLSPRFLDKSTVRLPPSLLSRLSRMPWHPLVCTDAARACQVEWNVDGWKIPKTQQAINQSQPTPKNFHRIQFQALTKTLNSLLLSHSWVKLKLNKTQYGNGKGSCFLPTEPPASEPSPRAVAAHTASKRGALSQDREVGPWPQGSFRLLEEVVYKWIKH